MITLAQWCRTRTYCKWDKSPITCLGGLVVGWVRVSRLLLKIYYAVRKILCVLLKYRIWCLNIFSFYRSPKLFLSAKKRINVYLPIVFYPSRRLQDRSALLPRINCRYIIIYKNNDKLYFAFRGFSVRNSPGRVYNMYFRSARVHIVYFHSLVCSYKHNNAIRLLSTVVPRNWISVYLLYITHTDSVSTFKFIHIYVLCSIT